jgi:hypothetical protein
MCRDARFLNWIVAGWEVVLFRGQRLSEYGRQDKDKDCMLKSVRILATVLLAIAGVAAAASAKASTTEDINLTLANGAVFNGTLTFSTSSLTDLTGLTVDGTLTDYKDGTLGKDAGHTDTIHVVDTGILTTYSLLGIDHIVVGDTIWGSPALTHQNRITLTINTNDTPAALIDTIGPLPVSGIDLTDPSGDRSDFTKPNGAPVFTPEPGTFLLLGSGLVGLAGIVRRKIGVRG